MKKILSLALACCFGWFFYIEIGGDPKKFPFDNIGFETEADCQEFEDAFKDNYVVQPCFEAPDSPRQWGNFLKYLKNAPWFQHTQQFRNKSQQ